ncbi:MAG TPA: hypothetical protein VM888_12735, partial [Chitinophagaceae bacterium]|nr:hypothetical protein [Chitinophagaceae bacterium]
NNIKEGSVLKVAVDKILITNTKNQLWTVQTLPVAIATVTNITTGINDPLPVGTSITLLSNPVVNNNVMLRIQTPQGLDVELQLYTLNGVFIGAKKSKVFAGDQYVSWQLPQHLNNEMYVLKIVSDKWETSKKVVLLK